MGLERVGIHRIVRATQNQASSRLLKYGHALHGKEALAVDIETWSLIATVIFGLAGGFAGVVAALYGIKSFRASRAQLEIARDQAEDSREQLELARNQASLVPRIDLMEMSLHPLADDPELQDEVSRALQEMDKLRRKRAEEERVERAREERERRMREEQERQERAARERKRGFNAETVEQMEDISPFELLKRIADPSKALAKSRWVDQLANRHLSTPPRSPNLNIGPTKRVYEGPVPNYYLERRNQERGPRGGLRRDGMGVVRHRRSRAGRALRAGRRNSGREAARQSQSGAERG